MTDVHRAAGPADRMVFKAIPTRSVLGAWTPHGSAPLRARPTPVADHGERR